MDSEKKLAQALSNSPFSFALIDSSESYLFVTNAYAKRFDLEPELMVGRPLRDYFEPWRYEQEIAPRMQKCFSGQTVGYQIERNLNSVDRLLTIRYLPCFDDNGDVWAVLNMAVDITSDCRSVDLPDSSFRYWDGSKITTTDSTYIDNSEIQVRVARSEQLSSLGRSIAMLNHEMRSPLGTVSASLISLRRLLPESTEVNRIFDRCSRAMSRCERVVSDLLDYSKPFTVQPLPHDLDHWIEQQLHDYRVPASMSVVWLPGAVGEVWLDDEMMCRALINLMDNSVRAIQQQPSCHKRVLTLQTDLTEQGVALIITDTGAGFPQALQVASAAERFKTDPQGTGFGLLIASQIVEQHRGLLNLGNSSEGGAQVSIRFPLKQGVTANTT